MWGRLSHSCSCGLFPSWCWTLLWRETGLDGSEPVQLCLTSPPPCLSPCQVLANGLDNKLREDLERLKKIRAHRGLRHFWGYEGVRAVGVGGVNGGA